MLEPLKRIRQRKIVSPEVIKKGRESQNPFAKNSAIGTKRLPSLSHKGKRKRGETEMRAFAKWEATFS